MKPYHKTLFVRLRLPLLLGLIPLGIQAAPGVEYRNSRISLNAPGSPNAAGFVAIHNKGDTARRIVRVESPAARAVEVHTHVLEGGLNKMRPHGPLDLPAESVVDLKPGGLHLMMIGLTQPLAIDARVPVTFHYADGSDDVIHFTVRPPDAQAHVHHHGKNSGGGHGGHAHHGADMLPPAGVMGAHMHEPGNWVLDYRYMFMSMDHLLDGSRPQSPEEILYGIYNNPRVLMPMTGLLPPSPLLPAARTEANEFRYMSVGTDMTMEMHMVSAMYQYSADVMLMFMVPYVENRMGMLANNFQTSNMVARGVGDVSFSATYRVLQKKEHALFLGLGLSAPTGSIDERDYMPQMGVSPMGYAMQPGVGTYAVLTQVGYTGRAGRLSWGSQFDGILRSGKNENNYRAGNRFSGSAWAAYRVLDWCSTSLRAQEQKWDNYSGMDPSLDPTMDPSNDPKRTGGRRVDVFLGANLMLGGPFAGLLALVEFGVPVHQHLNGPQMAVDRLVQVGLQYTL